MPILWFDWPIYLHRNGLYLGQSLQAGHRAMERSDIRQAVVDFVAEIAELDTGALTDETTLVGAGAVMKSRQLIELLLALEDFADEQLGVTFDWASDSAMSVSRNMFRTVGTLVDHLHWLAQSTR